MTKIRPVMLTALLLSAVACTTVRQLRPADTIPVNGQAERTRASKALDFSIATRIAAPADVIWAVLTDGPAFTSWNSTVVSLEGTIATGSTIKLVSKVAPKRTFKLKVTTFEAPRHMVWEDGGAMFLGVRHFTLLPAADGSTTFVMSETYSGGMLGMIAGSLPDMTVSFGAFAADLKRQAESRATH